MALDAFLIKGNKRNDLENHSVGIEKSEIEWDGGVVHPEEGLFGPRENKEHSPIGVQGIAIHQARHLFLGAQSDFYGQSLTPDF